MYVASIVDAAALAISPARAFFTIMKKERDKAMGFSPERVKALRGALGLSQAKFARALGLALSTVCHWEQGLRQPDAATSKLLRILEKHPELIDS